jgi:hypothetical protein
MMSHFNIATEQITSAELFEKKNILKLAWQDSIGQLGSCVKP